MKKIGILIIVSWFIFGFGLSKQAQKKINKTIAALWPEKEIQKTPIQLPQEYRGDRLLKLENKSTNEGYAYLSQAASRSDKIDYMVIFNPDLSVLKVQVLVYREDYGGEVGSKRWLKQFVGKSGGEKMKFGHDIQNISGATISARSLTKGVTELSKNIKELKSKGLL